MGEHIVLLAALVAVLASFGVDGANPFYPGPGAGQRPARCCLPQQFSATMTLLETINSATPTVMETQMDFERGQQVWLNYTGSATPSTKMLVDYKKKMLYIVPVAHPQYCLKLQVPMPLARCTPENAEYMAQGYMGAGQLLYDTWRVASEDPIRNVVLTRTVSREGCVPLVEGMHVAGDYPDQVYLYSEFQAGLTDASVFDLPASCSE